jgi:hypothetical protein
MRQSVSTRFRTGRQTPNRITVFWGRNWTGTNEAMLFRFIVIVLVFTLLDRYGSFPRHKGQERDENRYRRKTRQ